tara:strand:+ start:2348 stop:3208 length:861 start_codon:yes stop_codon:yes gene_type:complete
MKNQITIFCDGGLGNRLNSLIGGICTAKKLGRTYIIDWPSNNWCGCFFHDLFDTTIPVVTYGINELFKNNIENIFMIHKNQTEFKLDRCYIPNERSLKEISNKEDHIIYYHDQIPPFVTKDDIINILSEIKIQNSVRDEIIKFCIDNKIDSTTCGMHLRLTDRNMEININGLYHHIISNPGMKFFVCSDDKETESKFNLLNNVCTYKKTEYVQNLVDGTWNTVITDDSGRSFPYNVNRPKDSVVQAFVDMLILSRTSMMDTNKYSSFLKMARLYNNVTIEVNQKND